MQEQSACKIKTPNEATLIPYSQKIAFRYWKYYMSLRNKPDIALPNLAHISQLICITIANLCETKLTR